MISGESFISEQSLTDLAKAQARFTRELFGSFGGAQPPSFAQLFAAWVGALASNPQRVEEIQRRHYEELLALWTRTLRAQGACGQAREPADRRFSAPEWRALAWFDYLRETYALVSRWMNALVEAADVDATTRRRLRFYVRQMLDAAAPSNFAATNPEAIKLALESEGKSLASGLSNLLSDTVKGRVSTSDETAFAVGRNLAIQPGAVVYRNELIELLQYRPLTERVHTTPLLIVPPCINKYYVLDLQPESSFVRHAVAHGLTVFMISWRNIDAALGTLRWDDYLERGVVRAIDKAREICAVAKVNALGFCVGGTMLACALAALARKRRRPVASMTLLASMLDFCDTGEISVYVDADYVASIEHAYRDGGVFPGAKLAGAFASLRANDLVWSYVVNNYLKGRTPPAFDLLYWNGDSANLPGPMYAYYLRNMYLENRLAVADATTMCGVPIDLGRIKLPSYVLATAEDHIVPWQTAYAGAQRLGGRVEFVLGASGHIAGVVNPLSKDRRSFRTGPMAPSAQAWLDGAQTHAGSWWKHWTPWIKARSGAEIAARETLGDARNAPLEEAPGTYVRVRC